MTKAKRSERQEPAASDLLAWYDRHRRDLPWRAKPGDTPDPYAVWLSEIMLQQTTAAAVKAYYVAFLVRWPTVEALAAADSDDVLRAWAGLGYYSRARNLHACAKIVADAHGGRFPADEAALRRLPGIGAYTAAAIAAIAFGQRAVVVDGNVERVIARLDAIEEPLPKAKATIRAVADALTPDRRAGDFAQAMMDLGATICTPRRPACALCPFMAACKARLRGEMERFPLKAPKHTRPLRAGAVFYARRADGMILVRTRPPKGLLGGMTDLPGGVWRADFNPALGRADAPFQADWRLVPGVVDHTFTHFELRLSVFVGTVQARTPAPDNARWTPESTLDQEALPTVFRKAIALARGDGAPISSASRPAAPRRR